MGVGHKQGFDKVFVFGGGGLFAAPAAPLRLIVAGGLGFDVAAVGEGNHHFARGNQVFVGNVAAKGVDFAAALIAKLLLHGRKFVVDDFVHAFAFGQNVEQVQNHCHHVFVFRHDFVLLKPGEPLQAHVQNGLGLGVGEEIAFAREPYVFRQPFGFGHAQIHIHAGEHIGHQAGTPRARHQGGFGFGRGGGGFNQGDDFVDIRQGYCQAFQNMAALAGFF